jgi:hypothetical protein
MAALPLSAQTTCQQVIDSRSYDDGGSGSWCWLSGLICYYCWGSNPDEHCANDWQPCDVRRKKPPTPIMAEARPLPAITAPCAAKTLEPVPQQVKLEHVL